MMLKNLAQLLRSLAAAVASLPLVVNYRPISITSVLSKAYELGACLGKHLKLNLLWFLSSMYS